MYPETAEKLLQSLFCESLSLPKILNICIATSVHVLRLFCLFVCLFVCLYVCLYVCLFVCLFAVEDQLCDEIRKLQHYRENGITTLKGCPKNLLIAGVACLLHV